MLPARAKLVPRRRRAKGVCCPIVSLSVVPPPPISPALPQPLSPSGSCLRHADVSADLGFGEKGRGELNSARCSSVSHSDMLKPILQVYDLHSLLVAPGFHVQAGQRCLSISEVLRSRCRSRPKDARESSYMRCQNRSRQARHIKQALRRLPRALRSRALQRHVIARGPTAL